MKHALAVSMAMVAGVAAAAEKTYTYSCKGGSFTVTATLENPDRWSKNDPVILRIGDDPPADSDRRSGCAGCEQLPEQGLRILRVEGVRHADA